MADKKDETVRSEEAYDRKTVKYDKVKVTYVPASELWVNYDRNIRTKSGMETYGVTAVGDSYDLAGMRMQLAESEGVIREPLVGWRTIHPLTNLEVIEIGKGNRRAATAQEMVADPDVPESWKKNLNKIPIYILDKLTEAQKTEIIYDQDSKEFLHSEIVRDLFNLRALGWDYGQIVLARTEPLLKIMKGGADLRAEIRGITNPVDRKKKITVGMHGTIGNGLLDAYAIGAWMRKLVIQSYMHRDGLLGDDPSQMPYFNFLKGSMQDRVRQLKNAAKEDGSKFSPLMLIEGTKFKELADKFRKQDYFKEAPTTPAKRMMKRDEVVTLQAQLQSRAAKMALARVLGEPQPEILVEDTNAAILQTKVLAVENMLPLLTPAFRLTVSKLLLSPNVEDFQKFLEANMEVPAEPKEEETEIPLEATE